MQNAGFQALGLNWRYVAFEVQPAHLAAVIEGARRMGFMGLNLTVPHKVLALEFVDAIDTNAREWGAINTIVFEGSNGQDWFPLRNFDSSPSEVRSRGYNTDVDAITRAVTEGLNLKVRGSKILLLGAGGAGRAAALKLAADGAAELFLVNRTESKAVEIMNEIRQRYPAVKTTVGYPSGNVDLAVNATSLGLKPDDPLPVDLNQFPLRNASCLFDMIYRPAETKLLSAAREAGCKTANGLGMLLHQGAAAFELWTGEAAPVAAMRNALEKEIHG
jgi:shikimate dehydrogenase